MGQHDWGHAGFKAVPLCAVTRFQAQGFDIHHGAAVQGDQAVCRAHKVHAAPAWKLAVSFKLVAHHFRDGQFGNGLNEGFLQALGQARAFDGAVVKQSLGLAIRCALELRHGLGACTQSLQLFQQGRCGVAIGI